MDLQIEVGGEGITERRLAASTADLLKELRLNVDPKARLVKQLSEADAKGDLVTGTQIMLSFVAGGGVAKLAEVLFGFLSLNRKSKVVLKEVDGRTLELSLDFLNRQGAGQIIELVEKWLQNKAS